MQSPLIWQGINARLLCTGQLLDYNGNPISGGSTGNIVETGSWGAPSVISGAITVPAALRAKLYMTSNGGALVVSSIGNGAATQELYLVCTSNVNTLELDNMANVQLSGSWVGKLGSLLCLHWTPGLNKWLEDHRNEI